MIHLAPANARPLPILLSLLLLPSPTHGVNAQMRRAARAPVAVEILDGDRERDGLRGPVRRVRAEVVSIDAVGLAPTEGPRSLLEVTVYDAGGRRVANQTYPVVRSLPGRETYEHDAEGRLLATVVSDEHGRVLSRTVYAYEYDAHGNWVKMTASLAVVEAGAERLEPVEVTYRAISYYAHGEPAAPALALAAKEAAASPASSPPQAATATPEPGIETETENSAGVAGVGAEPATTDGAKPLDSGAPREAEPGAGLLFDAGVVNDLALGLVRPAYLVGRSAQPTPVVVTVEIIIDETGRVVFARAIQGPRELRAAAESVALKASFRPFRQDGRPVRTRGLLNYTFPFDPR